MTTSIDAMARKLASLERMVLAITGPQLANSSLDDGAIEEYETILDEQGEVVTEQLSSIIGRQFDGTHGVLVVAGPLPPVPAGLTMVPVPGGVELTWDGTWEGGDTVFAPGDWTHCEVHVATDVADHGIYFNTKRGEITSARGATVTVPVGGGVQVYAWLVARTAAGKYALGPAVGPVAGGKFTEADLDVDLSGVGGGTTIFYDVDPDVPTNPTAGDLWYRQPSNIAHRYVVDDLGVGEWVPLQDKDISLALAQAAAARDAAAAKSQVFTQPTEPTGLTADDVNDIWIDDDDGVIRTWTGTAWVLRQLGSGAIKPNSLIGRDVLATGTVSGDTLEGTAINGKTITGATVQTAEEGARITLDSLEGLRGINGVGEVKTQLDTDGKLTAVDATIVGELNTAAAGPRVRLSQDLSDPEMPTGSLEMYTGLPTDSPAQISATSWQELDGFGNPVTSSADLRIFGAAGELQLQPSIFLRGSKDLDGLWVRRIDLNGEVWAFDARWPLGIVAGTGVFVDTTLTTSASAETRLAGPQNHASVPLRKGRAYEAVYVGLIQANTAAANRCIVTIRVAPENTTPTTTSNLASWVSIHVPLVGAAGQGTVDTSGQPFTVGSDRSLAFHIFAANNAATGTVSLVPTGPSTATPAPKHGIIIRDIGTATADMRVLAA